MGAASPRPGLTLPALQTQLIQMVVWMLQHRLLVQLHTYACLMASPSEDEPRPREDEVPFTARVGGRSLSTPNALSFGSPSRNPLPKASGLGGGGEHLGVEARRSDKGPAGNDTTPSHGHTHMYIHRPSWAAGSSCRQPPLKDRGPPRPPPCAFVALRKRPYLWAPALSPRPGIRAHFMASLGGQLKPLCPGAYEDTVTVPSQKSHCGHMCPKGSNPSQAPGPWA